jgi:hypothetical protein
MADKNLKNTVLIENEEYDINAVYSDKAGEVVKPLKVSKSGTHVFDFKGDVERVIDYVPADEGGSFKKPVHILTPSENPTYTEVITAGQIDNQLTNLHGSPICVWNTDNLNQLHSLKADDNKTYKLTTIVGTEGSFEAFKNYLSDLSEGLSFTTSFDGKTCYLSGIGSCTDSVVRIPEYNNAGLPVTYIGSAAFRNFKTSGRLNELFIPCGPTYIGASAFYGCTTLQKVHVSDSVNEIKENAFYDCSNLTDVNLGSGIRTIGAHVFHGCVNLEGISLPTGITTIADGLFFNCKKLDNVFIPEGVTSIGDTSFADCAGLTTITIPKSVKTIGTNAFTNCAALKNVNFGGTETEWQALRSQSPYLTNVTVTLNFEYPETTGVVGGVVRVSDTFNGPFLYICRDTDEEFNYANKMYLKLPGDDTVVEISRGATRLNSTTLETEQCYTYEGLVEIIARINNRLAALDNEKLAISEDILNIPSKLIPTENIYEQPAIPTLQQQITDIIEGTTVVSEATKATKDSEDLDIRQGYYRSASNNANKITISTKAPTSSTVGSIGDIIIVVEP